PLLSVFVSSMIPPPPRSTLCPYTTLFRSFLGGKEDDLAVQQKQRAHADCAEGEVAADGIAADAVQAAHDPVFDAGKLPLGVGRQDRKSTRLNSSHVSISYAVFCLKKKTRT